MLKLRDPHEWVTVLREPTAEMLAAVPRAGDSFINAANNQERAELWKAMIDACPEPTYPPIWRSWNTDPPPAGSKVLILCNDGCSSKPALVAEEEGRDGVVVLDGEDGMDLTDMFLDGSLWAPLPDDYRFMFMNEDDR